MSIDPKSMYYDKGGIETMNIVKAKLTPEQFKNLLTDNEPDIVSVREPVYNVWG